MSEYEVIGDDEWCAGSTDWETAVDYAAQYAEDYSVVEVYEVTRKRKMKITKNKVSTYE
jgi:hypothetical protein